MKLQNSSLEKFILKLDSNKDINTDPGVLTLGVCFTLYNELGICVNNTRQYDKSNFINIF